MRNVVDIENNYDVALLPAARAVVTSMSKMPRTTNTIEKNTISSGIAEWGEDNKFPQNVIDDVRKDPELGTLLNRCAELMYGSGMTFGTLGFKNNGEEFLKPLEVERHQQIAKWFKRSNINRYLFEACKDLSWYYNVFPEIVRNVGGTEIVQIAVQAAEDCRWELQNKTTGIVEKCFVNSNFATGTFNKKDAYTKTIPVLDPYYDAAESLRLDKRGNNFIYPLSIPTPGNKYYQLADWNSIRVSGWLSVSQRIPKLKEALLANQMAPRFHIEISDMYWVTKFENWSAKTTAEKNEIKRQELQSMSDTLAGAERAGKNFYSVFKTDFNQGREMSLFKITEIAQPVGGQFLEDGKDASLYKMSAVGLHPALVGSMPNSGMGGAGSNIREAYNLHILTCQFKQHLILEPLYLIRDYNGWGEDIEFRFKNSFMNTLDVGTETTPTTNGTYK